MSAGIRRKRTGCSATRTSSAGSASRPGPRGGRESPCNPSSASVLRKLLGAARAAVDRGGPPLRAHVGPNRRRRVRYWPPIHRVLADQRVLGEARYCGGKTIMLFPPIIGPATFERVQAAKRKAPLRLAKVGGTKVVGNLFTGIALWSRCDAPMTLVTNRPAARNPIRYLCCVTAGWSTTSSSAPWTPRTRRTSTESASTR